MALYQCVTCEAFETITQFTPEACSSCGGTLRLVTDPEDQLKEPAEVVHNNPATWLGAIWHVLEMAREDCISEDQNGPHDRAWEEVCTAMAWLRAALCESRSHAKSGPAKRRPAKANSENLNIPKADLSNRLSSTGRPIADLVRT